MTSFEKKVFEEIENFFPHKNLPKKIAVAVSGGVDSLALTVILQKFCSLKKIKLFAVTVDHKIRKSSSSEALELNKFFIQKKI